jgi:hypothetical protein
MKYKCRLNLSMKLSMTTNLSLALIINLSLIINIIINKDRLIHTNNMPISPRKSLKTNVQHHQDMHPIHVPRYTSRMYYNLHKSYTKDMPQTYSLSFMICINHVHKYVPQTYSISFMTYLNHVPKYMP